MKKEWLILLLLVFLVFRSWFGPGEISAGDAAFYFEETLQDFPWQPFLWSNNSLGYFNPLLFSFPYLTFFIKLLSFLGLTWFLIERLSWYWPFLGLSLFSAWFLFKTLRPKTKLSFLSPLIYLLNTYILMIIGGGQISIALAYAVAPLIFGLFIRIIQKARPKLQLLAGLTLAFQIAFEPRIAALTILASFGYLLLVDRPSLIKLLRVFSLPLLIIIGFHFYWLLPVLTLRRESFSLGLTFLGWAEFLSFADFSNSLSLLHPNWPENLFGKTYFMRPEFLVIPILAFASLLFIKDSKSKTQNKSQYHQIQKPITSHLIHLTLIIII